MNKFHTSHKQHQQLHDSSPTSLSLIEIASKYYLEDLPGASIPGSRITNILKQVESETPLSNLTLEYLRKNGFLALLQFAKNEISFTDFLKIAEPEATWAGLLRTGCLSFQAGLLDSGPHPTGRGHHRGRSRFRRWRSAAVSPLPLAASRRARSPRLEVQ